LKSLIETKKREYQANKNDKRDNDLIEKYGAIFRMSNLDNLSEEDFKTFLNFKFNNHWTNLERHKNQIIKNNDIEDLNKLRTSLKILVDETKPIKNRLDILIPKNKPKFIKFLGRAILTAILTIVFPTKYCIYNSTTEEALKKLGLFPKSKNRSFSDIYLKVNELSLKIAKKYNLSLLMLDSLFWDIVKNVSVNTVRSSIQSILLDKNTKILNKNGQKIINFLKREMNFFSTIEKLIDPEIKYETEPGRFEDKTEEVREIKEIEITQPTFRQYARITFKRSDRSFFPGYKVEFTLKTDIGALKCKVSSGSEGTEIGDSVVGQYITGDIGKFYDAHPELNIGDFLVFTKLNDLIYEVEIKK